MSDSTKDQDETRHHQAAKFAERLLAEAITEEDAVVLAGLLGCGAFSEVP